MRLLLLQFLKALMKTEAVRLHLLFAVLLGVAAMKGSLHPVKFKYGGGRGMSGT
jgi:hypothetical protein